MTRAVCNIMLLWIAVLAGVFLAACTGTDTTSSEKDGGDESIEDGDKDFINDDEPDSYDGDGYFPGDDDSEEPAGPDGDSLGFYPPMISDPSMLTLIFGPELTSANVNYGDAVRGVFTIERPYLAYTFDALPGAKVTLDLLADDPVWPVVVLYGPRGSNGLWREAIAVSTPTFAGGVMPRRAIIDGFPITAYGHYLVLVVSQGMAGSRGNFVLSLGCANLCREPSCPDLTCQGYCASGFLRDPDGCPSCYCLDSPDSGGLPCFSDLECPPDSLCVNGMCQQTPAEDCYCDPDYMPVCGEDGVTYANSCEATCRGTQVRHDGECPGPEGTECRYDSDCPVDMVCLYGVCTPSSASCGCPEIWEPVCGVDGVTYDNTCLLACQGVSMAYRGVCQGGGACRPVCDDASGAQSWADPCTGKTLAGGPCTGCESQCMFAGSPAEGWYSSCDRSLILKAACGQACSCPDVWDPVCGADGRTYPNHCASVCATVAVAYQGECQTAREGCLSDGECPPGQVCEPSDCNGQSPCPGQCVAPSGGSACVGDSDCAPGQYCYAANAFSTATCVDVAQGGCRVTGCFAEICAPYHVATACIWQPDLACFDQGFCEVAADGRCAWVDGPNGDLDRCMARVEMGTSCTVDRDCPTGYFCEQHTVCSPSECVCPDLDAPVCGVDGRIYPNACRAACATIRVLSTEGCR